MIIAANGAFCQQSVLLSAKATPKTTFFTPIYKANFYQPAKAQMVPVNFNCSQLGFFCKQELRFESVTKVPFKFRLGSIQYNDWMEGKINTGIWPVR